MMYGIQNAVQLSVLVRALGVGYLLGVLFGVYSLIKALLIKNRIVLIFTDIFVIAFFSLISFLFIFEANYGVLRFYIFSGEIIGFCIFLALAQPFYLSVLKILKKTREKLCLKLKKHSPVKKKRTENARCAGFLRRFGKNHKKN